MNWILVPQKLIDGTLQGGVLALIAIGIVLIYRSSEIFNFAQGHMLMIGAYLTWLYAQFVGGFTEEKWIILPVAIVLALISAVILGFLIERFALRPMTGQPLLSIILMTLGLSQLFEGVISLSFGVEPLQDFPSLFSSAASKIFVMPTFEDGSSIFFLNQLVVPYNRLAAFIVAIIACFCLMAYFRFTDTGLSMRATSENHELARSVGIRVPRVFALSWAIAGIIATLGGILLASISGVSTSLALVALAAFPAILLGGLESFAGAMIGGVIIGLAQALVQASKLVEVRNSFEITPYILLLLVLVFIPEGLFGQKRIDRI
ncbi:MAG: branched-chain amino acid transport system permease protein [Cellvibrionaceae bacterium]|jgi:branched-chain amino acid transport system permease protein